jgi:hypothetical protein
MCIENQTIGFNQFVNQNNNTNKNIINNFLYNLLILYLLISNELIIVTFIISKNTNKNIYKNIRNTANGIHITLINNNIIIIGTHQIISNQCRKLFQIFVFKIFDTPVNIFSKYMYKSDENTNNQIIFNNKYVLINHIKIFFVSFDKTDFL